MIKFLALTGVLYGVGVLGVGIDRTVEHWDGQDVPTLIQSGLMEGLVWPANFFDWVTHEAIAAES